ncbi:hypothetical protein EW145_g6088 [Phellinidium pouzarii]|uniref:Uncharacterized protein n=1 Tax=Phellinidium pouzarii TaxID=167371 RepID=A0A4S4KZL2_9AGAM|nr:hypothetical protein EW145_g6088 [Phellinidium pouzarii]
MICKYTNLFVSSNVFELTAEQARPLANNAPFNHVLRLFIVSSHSHCDFGSVHRASAAILLGMVLDKPLEIDFDEWRLLKKALSAADESDAEELKSSLRKALYYSYTIQSDIVFDEGPSESTKTTESPIANAESNVPLNHISGTEAALCEGLMTNIAEHFSSIIFQPPGALHMECTDVYAALWMERAVQPAISDNGTADPFVGRLTVMLDMVQIALLRVSKSHSVFPFLGRHILNAELPTGLVILLVSSARQDQARATHYLRMIMDKTARWSAAYTQVEASFLPNVGRKPEWASWTAEDTLFATWVGINDCGFGCNRTESIQKLFEIQQRLYENGARNFMFVNLPPMLRSPMGQHQISRRSGTDPYREWNTMLRASASAFAAAHADATVLVFSAWNLFDAVLDAPVAHGFAMGDSGRIAGGIWVDRLHPST